MAILCSNTDAQTINFDTQSTIDSFPETREFGFSDGGFDFSSTAVTLAVVDNDGSNFFAGSGSVSLLASSLDIMSVPDSATPNVTFASTSGETFSLISFQGSEAFRNVGGFLGSSPSDGSDSITVTGTLAGGAAFAGVTVALDDAEGFQLFAPTALSGLVFESVTFTGSTGGTGGQFGIDNITVEVSPIPEPGSTTIALFAFSTLLVRRKRS